jgi:hypothetical protein
LRKNLYSESMKWIFSITLCLIAEAALCQPITANDSMMVLKRPKYSILCPGTWTIDSSGTLGADIFLLSPLVGSDDNFRENINVFAQNLQGYNYDLQRMGKESEAQIGNFVTNAEILESRLDTSSSINYYLIRYKGQQGKFMLTTEQRYFLKNDIGFAITFTVQQGKEEIYSKISRLIFDSLTLL